MGILEKELAGEFIISFATFHYVSVMNSAKVFLTLLFTGILSVGVCDVIPENSHYVEKCARITNISDFENLTLLGYVLFIGTEHEETYIITDDCLSKGYKFNSLDIFAVSSSYIEGKDIDEIDLPNDDHAYIANLDIEPYAGYYHDSIPIDRLEEYYRILGFTDSTVVLHMWKEVFGFNNGSADSILFYEYEGDTTSLSQIIPTGFPEPDKMMSIINIYPSPANSRMSVEISNNFYGSMKIQLITQNGNELNISEIEKDSEQITIKVPVQNLATGIYILKMEFDDAIESRQIVIQ